MTEPMNAPDVARFQLERDSPGPRPVSLGDRAYRPPRGDAAAGGPERSEPKNLLRTTSLAFASSGDVGVRVAEVVLHGPLGHAEGTADTDGGESAGVDEAVHGHLRDPHHRGDLGDGQEGHGGAGGRDYGTADRHGGRAGGGDRAGQRGRGRRDAGGA